MRFTLGKTLLVFCVLAVVIGSSEAWAYRRTTWLQKLLSRFTKNFRKYQAISTTPADCVPTSGYDPETNWCFGTYCDENGNKLAWDKWNCKPTTSTTSPSPPTTTPMTTPPPGCKYNGKYYSPGTQIERGEDRASNWCWVVYCSKDGHLLHGDDFNCFPTTTSTTLPPSTPPPLTSPPSTSPQ